MQIRFFQYMQIKTKYCTRLDVIRNIKIQLSILFSFCALKKTSAFVPLRHCVCFVELFTDTFIALKFVLHYDL